MRMGRKIEGIALNDVTGRCDLKNTKLEFPSKLFRFQVMQPNYEWGHKIWAFGGFSDTMNFEFTIQVKLYQFIYFSKKKKRRTKKKDWTEEKRIYRRCERETPNKIQRQLTYLIGIFRKKRNEGTKKNTRIEIRPNKQKATTNNINKE